MRLRHLLPICGLLSGCALPVDTNIPPTKLRWEMARDNRPSHLYLAQPYAVAPATEIEAFSKGREGSIPPLRHYVVRASPDGSFSVRLSGYLCGTLVWIIPPIPHPSEILLRLGNEPAQTYTVRYEPGTARAQIYRFDPISKKLIRDRSWSVTSTIGSQENPPNSSAKDITLLRIRPLHSD